MKVLISQLDEDKEYTFKELGIQKENILAAVCYDHPQSGRVCETVSLTHGPSGRTQLSHSG